MLTSSLSECFDIFTQNKRIIEELDFIFAKAKLSVDLNRKWKKAVKKITAF